MKDFDIQGIALNTSKSTAFEFIAEPNNLPKWTSAFASVDAEKAIMRTPEGEVEIDLEVLTSAEHGSIDWRMTFPDSSVTTAFSRLVEANKEKCIYGFILMPPPVPLEELEGALQAQSQILNDELIKLKGILEQDE